MIDKKKPSPTKPVSLEPVIDLEDDTEKAEKRKTVITPIKHAIEADKESVTVINVEVRDGIGIWEVQGIFLMADMPF